MMLVHFMHNVARISHNCMHSYAGCTGVQSGDFVGVLLSNSAAFVAIQYAIAKIGGPQPTPCVRRTTRCLRA
jgi:acyl-CoA synthetase (AMP-forming)/AMP-acid ligase II